MANVNLEGPLFDTPELAATLRRHFLAEMQQRADRDLVPKLRAVTPRRTGKLRSSLYRQRTQRTLAIGFERQGYYFAYQDGLVSQFFGLWGRYLSKHIGPAYRAAVNKTLPPAGR